MYKVQIDHMELYYFPKHEEVPRVFPDGQAVDVQSLNQWNMFNVIQEEGDIRAVVTAHAWKSNLFYFYLFWKNSPDLLDLDDRIAHQTYTVADFDDAIVTELARTACLRCENWVGYTLNVAYLTIFSQINRWVDKQWSKFETLKCPVCGERFNLPVVKFLDESFFPNISLPESPKGELRSYFESRDIDSLKQQYGHRYDDSVYDTYLSLLVWAEDDKATRVILMRDQGMKIFRGSEVYFDNAKYLEGGSENMIQVMWQQHKYLIPYIRLILTTDVFMQKYMRIVADRDDSFELEIFQEGDNL